LKDGKQKEILTFSMRFLANLALCLILSSPNKHQEEAEEKT
jgi:hypothetical protein